MAKKEQTETPAANGMMKTATVLLKLSRDQTVVKTHVTPAQAFVLTVMHVANAGGEAPKVMQETEPLVRTDREEIARLRRVYGPGRIKSLFGPNSSLPATFDDAIQSGVSWALENPGGDGEPLVGRRLTAEEASAFVG
jgi:hypothetical protein